VTVRQTSILAYDALKRSGKLSAGRWEVYHDVFHNGPTTSGEFFARAAQTTTIPSQKRARFTELRDMGLFVEADVRPCKITGNRAIAWDVTGRSSPLALPKRKSYKAKLADAEDRIAELESALAASDARPPTVSCPGCAAQSRAKVLPQGILDAINAGKSTSCKDCGLRMHIKCGDPR
jgi:hypothetical protein